MTNEPHERAFILKWRSAVLNSSLGSSTKLCLLGLAEFADKHGADCYPSIPSIARLTSVNEKTVRRNLAPAEVAGYIRRFSNGTSHGWRHYKYDLSIPAGADTTPARASLGAGTKSTPAGVTNGHSAQNVWTLRPKGAGTKSTELASKYEKASMDSLSARAGVMKSEAVRKLENEKYMVANDLKLGDILTPEAASARIAEIDRAISAEVAKAVSA